MVVRCTTTLIIFYSEVKSTERQRNEDVLRRQISWPRDEYILKITNRIMKSYFNHN